MPRPRRYIQRRPSLSPAAVARDPCAPATTQGLPLELAEQMLDHVLLSPSRSHAQLVDLLLRHGAEGLNHDVLRLQGVSATLTVGYERWSSAQDFQDI